MEIIYESRETTKRDLHPVLAHIEPPGKERIRQSDNNPAKESIRAFTQGKPLSPGVYDSQYAAFSPAYQQFPTGGSAVWTDKVRHAVEKIVFVENTGKQPCRT